MPTINLTAAEIEARLALANTSIQPTQFDALAGIVDGVEVDVGDLTVLNTTNKTNLVEAVNELFTSASNGKTAIAAAITGEGITTAADDTYDTMVTNISLIRDTWIEPKVNNGLTIVPTGTYANLSYYDVTYGVKIAYMPTGEVMLSMKGGTSASYEYLYFTLTSAPVGVTLITSNPFITTSYINGSPTLIYAVLLSGITGKVNIDINMNTINSTYDFTQCAITVTAV